MNSINRYVYMQIDNEIVIATVKKTSCNRLSLLKDLLRGSPTADVTTYHLLFEKMTKELKREERKRQNSEQHPSHPAPGSP